MFVAEKQPFVISSRTNPFTYNFAINTAIKFSHVAVYSASIPKTYRVLPVDAVLVVGMGPDNAYITFPSGNYNRDTFQTKFRSLLSGLSWTFNISYPDTRNEPDTLSYTYTVSGNAGIQPTFYTTNDYLAQTMGMTSGTTYSFENDTLESVNSIDFQSCDFITISSDIVDNSNQILDTIIANVSLYNSAIPYINTDYVSNCQIISKKHENYFSFKLLDEFYNLIDFFGGSITLCIVFLRFDNIFPMFKNLLKIQSLNSAIDEIDK